MFLAVAAGTAPLTFGAVYDQTGAYTIPVVVAACLLLTGAVTLLLIGRHPDPNTFNGSQRPSA